MSQKPSKVAVVLVGATPVGNLKGFEHGIEVAHVEEHDLNSGDPVVSEPVDLSFPWTAEVGWIDNSWAAKILAGTTFTLEFRPEGTGGGLKKVTYSGAYLTKCRDKAGKLAVQLTNIEGRAASRLDGTQ